MFAASNTAPRFRRRSRCRDVEQLCGVPAENRDPIGVAQAGRRQNVIDGGRCPWERMVGPEHDLPDPGLRDEMAQRLTGEDE